MGLKTIFFILVMAFCLGAGNPDNREPDVKSQKANIEDYYTFDKESGKWIWSDDYPKFVAKRNALKAKQRQQKIAKQKAVKAQKVEELNAEELQKQRAIEWLKTNPDLDKPVAKIPVPPDAKLVVETDRQVPSVTPVPQPTKELKKEVKKTEVKTKGFIEGFFDRLWTIVKSFLKRLVRLFWRWYHKFF